MSKLRRFVVASLVLGSLAIALVGAGWKWQHGHEGYGQQKLAGWTWDSGVIAADPGNRNGNGNGNNGNSDPTP
jgi:hypothetical protein